MTRDWRAIPAHDSFGHDVETAYLLVEAAEALHMADDAKTWKVARGLLDHALDWGWDDQYGGFYDKGDAFATSAYDLKKVWWTEAEGLNALAVMDRKYGEQTDRYSRAFAKQWEFIQRYQLDSEHGGWFAETDRAGQLLGDGAKATQWKANYHSARALMNVARLLERRRTSKNDRSATPARPAAVPCLLGEPASPDPTQAKATITIEDGSGTGRISSRVSGMDGQCNRPSSASRCGTTSMEPVGVSDEILEEFRVKADLGGRGRSRDLSGQHGQVGTVAQRGRRAADLDGGETVVELDLDVKRRGAQCALPPRRPAGADLDGIAGRGVGHAGQLGRAGRQFERPGSREPDGISRRWCRIPEADRQSEGRRPSFGRGRRPRVGVHFHPWKRDDRAYLDARKRPQYGYPRSDQGQIRNPLMSLADLRNDYGRLTLYERDLDPDPIRQFDRWLAEAMAADVAEANAMTLATASPEGRPSARIVLLRGCDSRGFTFFTDHDSRKGRELDANPHAALVFFWRELERQVRVEGAIVRVSDDESDAYFRSRPFGSRVGAWASDQSQVLPNREALETQYRAIEAKYPHGEVPRPVNWGGYRVVPETIEFWQGRPSRLHDRLRYRKIAEGGWTIERLSP